MEDIIELQKQVTPITQDDLDALAAGTPPHLRLGGNRHRRVRWPEGKDFAFTVFDDTDHSTLENAHPVYDLLGDLGFATTKSVWTFPPAQGVPPGRIGGSTCEDHY